MAGLHCFYLRPTVRGLRDPAWSRSRYRGDCRVVAENPVQARLFADIAFLAPIAAATMAQPSRSPWQQPSLVEVSRLPAAGAGRPQRGEVWCILPSLLRGAVAADGRRSA
ncbi:hypothetical protein E2C06_28725 [Dankookia rubra]|uniref:Uncharacterized protein n=1 Tax=Dankookia rubra TaxID=1442381 RepID=A0A4V3A9G4_9PROT|nr:hypothetical protein [Dankookia rubra]TDH59165.1 hypothetical protein E2C06_28725 [Dankookia rubra]